MQPEDHLGQPSWSVSSSTVKAWVTQTGGMLGPVSFDLGGRTVEPFSVAPWATTQRSSDPPIIRALRGDFFCMPFGNSSEDYLGESHPLHGETANSDWQFDAMRQSTLDIVLECKIRPCKVYKTVRCSDRVVYHRNTIIGLAGPMCYGMHAMLKFNSAGLVSTSETVWGQVFPDSFEEPAGGGYSSLKEGAEFDSLSKVPLARGGETDLTKYPSRAGFEDLVQIASNPKLPFAWTTVTFPEEGFVYFQLKDPRVLTGTVLWFSNGGRHYAPWNGQHRGVLGLEEVTSFFHLGLRGSVMPNPLQAHGISTYRDFNPGEPLEISLIQGVLAIPKEFDKVSNIVRTGSGIVLVSESGQRVEHNIDLMFLGVR